MDDEPRESRRIRPGERGTNARRAKDTAQDASWEAFIERIRARGPTWQRYEMRGEVARGGMGVIHRVFDRDIRRPLAMKVILGDEDAEKTGDTPKADPRSLGRFLDEAQVTGQLDHPGIVPVHELGVDRDGRVYFTMKLVKGEDLRSVFDRVHDPNDGAWNQTRALSALLRVCEAMTYAHSKGVIHRDLKPANVMVGKYGETYVMDWGLARVIGRHDSKDMRIRPPASASSVIRSHRKDTAAAAPDSPLVTMDGDVVGTPAYMSPEQARGELERVGPQSDVYSVGAMLYHLLAGHAPYVRPGVVANHHAIWRWVQEGPPAPIRQVAPDAPGELEAICQKAMQRDQADRYTSMADLARDVRAYLENRVVGAYETGAMAEMRKWVVRNKALAATATAAALLALMLSLWALMERGRALENEKAALANEREARTNERLAMSRKAEFDQLAGVVLLENALAKERDLYPPWPQKVEEMENWLAKDAARLIELMPAVTRTLTDLRRRALPWTEEQQRHDRATHPRLKELEPLSRQIASLRRARAVREGRQKCESASLPAEFATFSARVLNSYARTRVDPDVSNRVFGEERQALAAARAALGRTESGDTSVRKAAVLDTLAWALFANGLDEDALRASTSAVEAAGERSRDRYLARRQDLEEAIDAASGVRGHQVLERLESDLAALQAELASRRTWTFPEESESFLHEALQSLSNRIATFEEVELPSVKERLCWAKRIAELTRRHPNARVPWQEARDAIAAADGVVASDLYRAHPIDLKPQTGLVPIGMNPATGLWEFYHLRTAYDPDSGVDPAEIEIPKHRDDGTLELTDETGIVFVLIPGGTFHMGAQSTDPAGPNYDRGARDDEEPVRGVTLSPYFLSRFELTQGQWIRMTGNNPSFFRPDELVGGFNFDVARNHPVEQVSWEDCDRELGKLGLALPTEAQWEYAARAGTTTAWWTGETEDTLQGSAFVGEPDAPQRVGSFAANPFGLHDVIGNVWEWTRDWYGHYDLPARDGDGLRLVPNPQDRVYRGGSVFFPPWTARSSFRFSHFPTLRYGILGVRPSRLLDP